MTTIPANRSVNPAWLTALRWAARLGSLLVIGILLAFGFSGGKPPTLQEWIGLLFFPVGLIVGLALSWWREGSGAAVSLGSIAGFYVWFAVTRGSMAAGPYFLLLTLPAIGFGLYALLRRRLA